MKLDSNSQRKTYDIQQIVDYMECPLCYHLKYEKKLNPRDILLNENKNQIAKESLKDSVYHYYIRHQQGKPASLKELYNKFYIKWSQETGTVDKNSIFTRSLEDGTRHKREERSKLVTKGYESLKRFYATNATKKQAVIAVNHPYEINLNNIIIKGTIDLIREVETNSNERKIELVMFQFGTRKPNVEEFNKNIYLSTVSLAFIQMFDIPPDNIVLKYINRDEEYSVYFDSSDYKGLMKTIEAFSKSVDTIDPYQRPGGHIKYSPYQEMCNNYKF